MVSSHDRNHLATLQPKLQLVKDRVQGVCKQLSTGLYLWGEGGTSKSYTVLEELQRHNADYILHNARMTGRGLVDTLNNFPASIHVLEDAESMFDDRKAWGVLRSALWSQSKKKPPERQITWTAHRTGIDFTFTGGIIIIANRSLDSVPELAALQTRIPVLKLTATFDEIAALMRDVARAGYKYGTDAITPAECGMIVEWTIQRMRSQQLSLDMRIMVEGFKDYIQYKTGQSETHWENLLDSRIRRQTVVYKSRAERMAEEQEIAQEIMAKKISIKEKERLFRERTGKSLRALYRRVSKK